MRRHRVAPRSNLFLAALAACLLACAVLAVPTAARAADGTPKPDPAPKSAATVGIRTANAERGDDRGVYTYEILPRGVVQDWVSVTNYRTKPITVRLFAKDATSSPDSGFDIQPSAVAPRDLGSWISLKKNKLTIPARTEIVVPFQVGVPYNATPGDHAGAIVLSVLAKEPKPTGGSIVVDHRVAMRIHLRVPGDLKSALEIEDLNVTWNGGGHLLGRGDAVVSYAVRNTGNIRLNATGSIDLTRVLGLPSVTAAAPAVVDLLPGGVAQFSTVVPDVLGTGPMKAVVSLTGVPQDEALAAEVAEVRQTQGFAAWPWLLIVAVLLLLALLGTGGWYLRKRHRAQAAQAAALAAEEAEARARAKHRSLVRAVLAPLAPVLAAAALLGPGLVAPAHAGNGDQWQATISKKQGIALEPFDIQTSGACPLPATNVVGFGYGVGFPKEGAVVVSNTGGASSDGGFTVALVDSMKNIMALQPDPRGLRGTYRFVIRCIQPEFPDRSYGEYIAAIRFDDGEHWVAAAPLTTKKGPLAEAAATNGEPRSSAGAGAGSGAGPGSGTSPGATANPSPGGSAPLAQSPAVDGPTATAVESGGTNTVLLGIGVAVLVGSLLLAFGRRIPGPWRRP